MRYDNKAKIAEYRRTKSKRLRDEIFAANYAFVRLCAGRFRVKCSVPLADLEQAAAVGLLRAIETWDPERGTLTTHAGILIRREMQDEHRRQDPNAPLYGGMHAKQRARARAGETAEQIGCSPEAWARWVTDVREDPYHELQRSTGGADPELVRHVLASQGDSPERLADRARTAERVLVAVGALTETQRAALVALIEEDEPSSTADVVLEGLRRALA